MCKATGQYCAQPHLPSPQLRSVPSLVRVRKQSLQPTHSVPQPLDWQNLLVRAGMWDADARHCVLHHGAHLLLVTVCTARVGPHLAVHHRDACRE